MKNKEKSASAKTLTKSTTFTLELYPEWEQIATIVAYISNNYKYAYIEHNRDTNENGETKKTHIHVVIKCNRRRLTSVKNEFAEIGVPQNLINTCNERAMLRYLTHIDDKDKEQYQKSEIKTNMPEEVEQAYLDEISNEQALLILDEWIYKNVGIVTQHELTRYAYDNGLIGAMKKYAGALNNARIEHNKTIEKEEHINDLAYTKVAHYMKKEYEVLGKLVDMTKINGVLETTMLDSQGQETPVILTLKAENKEEYEEKENKRKISAIEIWEGIEDEIQTNEK